MQLDAYILFSYGIANLARMGTEARETMFCSYEHFVKDSNWPIHVEGRIVHVCSGKYW